MGKKTTSICVNFSNEQEEAEWYYHRSRNHRDQPARPSATIYVLKSGYMYLSDIVGVEATYVMANRDARSMKRSVVNCKTQIRVRIFALNFANDPS